MADRTVMLPRCAARSSVVKTRRSSPFPIRIADALDRLIADHAALGWDAPACGALKV